jgi:hypothetical protein
MDSLNAITYEGGRIVKMEVDYSPTCDETIPKCKEMVEKRDPLQSGNVVAVGETGWNSEYC